MDNHRVKTKQKRLEDFCQLSSKQKEQKLLKWNIVLTQTKIDMENIKEILDALENGL